MNELDSLRERIIILETLLNKVIYSDRYQFDQNIRIGDGFDVMAGTIKGTQIGTSATQKLGFFGATPVVQQTDRAIFTGNTLADLKTGLEALGLFRAV